MRTGVVGGDDLPGLGECHAVARLEGLDVYAHLRKRACVRACGASRRSDHPLSDLLTGVKGQLWQRGAGEKAGSARDRHLSVASGSAEFFFSIVSEEPNRACGTSGRGLARIGGGRRRIDIRVVHRARVSNRARDRALSSGTAAGRNPGVFEPRDG